MHVCPAAKTVTFAGHERLNARERGKSLSAHASRAPFCSVNVHLCWSLLGDVPPGRRQDVAPPNGEKRLNRSGLTVRRRLVAEVAGIKPNEQDAAIIGKTSLVSLLTGGLLVRVRVQPCIGLQVETSH